MKFLSCFIFYFLPRVLCAQIISTYAGGGSGVGGTDKFGDGLVATKAWMGVVETIAFDTSGNLYIPDPQNYLIRKVDKKTGIITSVVGTGTSGFSGDSGLATAAEISAVGYVAVDRFNNMYFVDQSNYRVRRVDANTGIITTIAGNGTAGFSGDGGLATKAQINFSAGIYFDKIGNLYISDNYNNRIRKIDKYGIISTYAGNGNFGFSGDGGDADSAEIWDVRQMCSDSIGNLYLGDIGNGRVRKIDAKTHIITTIAGKGDSNYYNGDGIPALSADLDPFGLTIDPNGNLIIGDHVNYRIRKIDLSNSIISTIAGNGLKGFSGDGHRADSAEFWFPFGIVYDKCGNLFIADNANRRIREVSFNSLCENSDTTNHTIVANVKGSTSLTIFPNPANKEITVTGSGKIEKLTITNAVGQVVYDGNTKTEKVVVDVSGFASGVYFVKVNGVWDEKFVKF